MQTSLGHWFESGSRDILFSGFFPLFCVFCIKLYSITNLKYLLHISVFFFEELQFLLRLLLLLNTSTCIYILLYLHCHSTQYNRLFILMKTWQSILCCLFSLAHNPYIINAYSTYKYIQSSSYMTSSNMISPNLIIFCNLNELT